VFCLFLSLLLVFMIFKDVHFMFSLGIARTEVRAFASPSVDGNSMKWMSENGC
jgi:hypothetical protein